MEEPEKRQELAAQPALKKDDRPLMEALNPKQRLFINLIMEGRKTLDAYKMAGYEGDDHAAYTMRTRLNKALGQLAEARGMTRADLMHQVANMMELPLIRVDGRGQVHNAEGITVDQFIKLAHLKEKIVLDRKERPQITAIQINLGDEENKTPKSIDVSAVTINETDPAGEGPA